MNIKYGVSLHHCNECSERALPECRRNCERYAAETAEAERIRKNKGEASPYIGYHKDTGYKLKKMKREGRR